VQPPQAFQLHIRKRLHTNGKPIDANFSQLLQCFTVNRCRITFQCNFRLSERNRSGNRLQNLLQQRNRQQGRRSTAKINRIYWQIGLHLPQKPTESRSILFHSLCCLRNGIEITIGALPHAKRDVNINPQRGFTRHRSAPLWSTDRKMHQIASKAAMLL